MAEKKQTGSTEYELFYLIGESKEVDMARIKDEIKAIVVKEGGEFLEGESTEKRKLAYPIRREIRGIYVAQRFTTADRNDREENIEKGEESIISRLTRLLNLYRDILRFIIVRAEDLPSLNPVEESAKVVEEVMQEAKVAEAAPKKRARVAKKEVEEVAEATEETKTPAAKKAKEAKSEMKEEDIDKKLEEVLNI